MRWELYAAGTPVAELEWLGDHIVPVRVNPPFACFLRWWLSRVASSPPNPHAFTLSLRELEPSGFQLVVGPSRREPGQANSSRPREASRPGVGRPPASQPISS
ncbi:MAG: hypothetical protein RDU89_02175 [bacterium]|nr:hypothetical protein [bacterium]